MGSRLCLQCGLVPDGTGIWEINLQMEGVSFFIGISLFSNEGQKNEEENEQGGGLKGERKKREGEGETEKRDYLNYSTK